MIGRQPVPTRLSTPQIVLPKCNKQPSSSSNGHPCSACDVCRWCSACVLARRALQLMDNNARLAGRCALQHRHALCASRLLEDIAQVTCVQLARPWA